MSGVGGGTSYHVQSLILIIHSFIIANVTWSRVCLPDLLKIPESNNNGGHT